MAGAISGGRPGRVETMTAPPLGTGVGVSRPKRGATAVTPPPVGGDSMHSGAPRKRRRIGQKMEGVEPKPFFPRCMRAEPILVSVSSARLGVPSRFYTRLRPN